MLNDARVIDEREQAACRSARGQHSVPTCLNTTSSYRFPTVTGVRCEPNRGSNDAALKRLPGQASAPPPLPADRSPAP